MGGGLYLDLRLISGFETQINLKSFSNGGVEIQSIARTSAIVINYYLLAQPALYARVRALAAGFVVTSQIYYSQSITNRADIADKHVAIPIFVMASVRFNPSLQLIHICWLSYRFIIRLDYIV